MIDGHEDLFQVYEDPIIIMGYNSVMHTHCIVTHSATYIIIHYITIVLIILWYAGTAWSIELVPFSPDDLYLLYPHT